MKRKINLTHVICFQIGKTCMTKTLPGDFKITTSENPLLSKQAVTSKGILVPYTNLQLNPYPNTQCTAPGTWLTNYTDLSTRLQSPTREGCWLQSFSVHHMMKIKKLIGHKPYGVQTQQLLYKEDELGQILSPATICLNKTLLNTCATCVTFNGP